MRSILEEFWFGNVCPENGCRESTPEAKALMGYIANHHEKLRETLTDKQKELFEKLSKTDETANDSFFDRIKKFFKN